MASEDLSKDALKKMAGETGLDQAKFGECVDKGTYKKDVDADVAAGEAVGIDGTPAFFINGRKVSGALPFDKFKEIIDEELVVNN
jgi:protein-disulfide isomerase